MIGFDPDWDRIFGGVAGFGECLEQPGEPGSVVVDSSPAHDFAQVVEDREVVMVFGPIDSAVQSHRASQCRCAGCEPVWCTRRPNCRTRRSVISPAVRDTSAPQGARSAEELTAREHRRRDHPCGGLVPRHFTTPNGALPGAASLPEGVACAGKTLESAWQCTRRNSRPA